MGHALGVFEERPALTTPQRPEATPTGTQSPQKARVKRCVEMMNRSVHQLCPDRHQEI